MLQQGTLIVPHFDNKKSENHFLESPQPFTKEGFECLLSHCEMIFYSSLLSTVLFPVTEKVIRCYGTWQQLF